MGLQTSRKMSRPLDMRFLTMESENICSAEALNIKERRKLELKWSDMERRHSYNLKRMSQDSYQMKRELTSLTEVKRRIHRQRSASVAGSPLSLADQRTLLLDRQRRASVSDAVTSWLAKLDAQNKQDKLDQTRKYSLDTLRKDISVGEEILPKRSALKSAPVSDQMRYKLTGNLKEDRKKSVTFVCNDKNGSDNAENEMNDEGDSHAQQQDDRDEYIAQYLQANNLDEGNELIPGEILYSEEGPKRLSKRKNLMKPAEDSKDVAVNETEEKHDNSEDPTEPTSTECLLDKIDGLTQLKRKLSNENEAVVNDVNNNIDESGYSVDRPMRLSRRNTIASMGMSMKKLTLGEGATEGNLARRGSAVSGQTRWRKSAVAALDPDFRALLEKQNEEKEKIPKERLLVRRKTEPAFVLSNFLKSIGGDLSADSDQQKEPEINATEKTCEEIAAEIDRNANNINALYLAKNKISNALYIAKGKMSNRPHTSVQENKAKPRVVGIPYHTEMRMKRKGKITLQLKAIYMDEAERKTKEAKRKLSKDLEYPQKKPSVQA